jgi:aminoglycoside 6'-N-acetyltransferase I
MIIEIQENNLKAWVELRHELWPMHTVDELMKESRESLADECQRSWFYMENDVPIGFIDLSLKEKAIGCSSTKIGYIEGWYVKPEFQRKGIGQSLYIAAESFAKSQGCQEMASDTTQDYPNSTDAHRKAGFKIARKAIHFYKEI